MYILIYISIHIYIYIYIYTYVNIHMLMYTGRPPRGSRNQYTCFSRQACRQEDRWETSKPYIIHIWSIRNQYTYKYIYIYIRSMDHSQHADHSQHDEATAYTTMYCLHMTHMWSIYIYIYIYIYTDIFDI